MLRSARFKKNRRVIRRCDRTQANPDDLNGGPRRQEWASSRRGAPIFRCWLCGMKGRVSWPLDFCPQVYGWREHLRRCSHADLADHAKPTSNYSAADEWYRASRVTKRISKAFGDIASLMNEGLLGPTERIGNFDPVKAGVDDHRNMGTRPHRVTSGLPTLRQVVDELRSAGVV